MDKQTFTDLVLDAEHTLYRVSKTILREDHDCEDAVQEAILKAYQKLDTLREERYFRTWLIRILINECYRIRRTARPVVSFEAYLESAPAITPDGSLWAVSYTHLDVYKRQAPLFSIFLTSSSAYFVGCSSKNAWPKQAEKVGVGSVIPRSVPASLEVNPDRK